MQKQKVVAWLAQHNFPHGIVYFIDGLSTDPLRQKANYLRNLTEQVLYNIVTISRAWNQSASFRLTQLSD